MDSIAELSSVLKTLKKSETHQCQSERPFTQKGT